MTRGTETPIFIPFRDRITVLTMQRQWLRTHGVPPEMIYIIDMGSTYPDTVAELERLEWRGYQIRRKDNLGAWGLFREGIIRDEIGEGIRFIVNDPDVIPDASCRPHLIDYLHDLMDQHPYIGKLGLGLRLDDLPDTPYAQHAKSHENRYWTKDFVDAENELYAAPIATTFFLCPGIEKLTTAGNDPNKSGGDPIEGYACARTKPPNLGRHLPWYMEGNLPEDEQYYYDNCPHRDRSKIPGTSWKP